MAMDVLLAENNETDVLSSPRAMTRSAFNWRWPPVRDGGEAWAYSRANRNSAAP